MLLLHANEVVSSDRLIDELWSGAEPRDAAKALSVAMARLRKTLEPAPPRAGHGELGRGGVQARPLTRAPAMRSFAGPHADR